MVKTITMGQLKALIDALPDGMILKVTFKEGEEEKEEGGDENGDKTIPLPGGLDPA